jgi:hypothetical protein
MPHPTKIQMEISSFHFTIPKGLGGLLEKKNSKEEVEESARWWEWELQKR